MKNTTLTHHLTQNEEQCCLQIYEYYLSMLDFQSIIWLFQYDLKQQQNAMA